MDSTSTSQIIKTLTLATVGFFARILTSEFTDTIRQRVEIITPISDWKRATEAVHLWSNGLDPYSGGVFHEYPISLQFYKMLSTCIRTDYAFAATDVITAILLQRAVSNHLMINGKSAETAMSRSMRVLSIYLLSPINIVSSAGMSTSIFTNFLIAVIYLILSMKPFQALTCVMCAFLACNNIHFSSIILPVFLCMEFSTKKNRRGRAEEESRPYYQIETFLSSLATSSGICLATVSILLLTSYILMGYSWAYFSATYSFVMKIQDLTPNIGMLWYLFTEMFDQFLDFFTWITQINSFIHVIPICIYLRDHPFFALYMMIVTTTIFQPYPSLCNIGLITSLLPQWSELFSHMRYGLMVICAMITCVGLWPIFWHLWIVTGTANSNFYFGSTLAFTIALILFQWDLPFAHMRLSRLEREKEEKNATQNSTEQAAN